MNLRYWKSPSPSVCLLQLVNCHFCLAVLTVNSADHQGDEVIKRRDKHLSVQHVQVPYIWHHIVHHAMEYYATILQCSESHCMDCMDCMGGSYIGFLAICWDRRWCNFAGESSRQKNTVHCDLSTTLVRVDKILRNLWVMSLGHRIHILASCRLSLHMSNSWTALAFLEPQIITLWRCPCATSEMPFCASKTESHAWLFCLSPMAKISINQIGFTRVYHQLVYWYLGHWW